MLLISALRYLTLRLSQVDFGEFNLRYLSSGQKRIIAEIFKRFILSDEPEEPNVENLAALYQKYMVETLKFKYPRRPAGAINGPLSFVEILVALYSFRSDGTIQIAPEFTSRHAHYCRLLFSTVLVEGYAEGKEWEAPDIDWLNDILEVVPSAFNPMQPSKKKGKEKEEEEKKLDDPKVTSEPVQDFEDVIEEESIESMFDILDKVTVTVPSEITSKVPSVQDQEGSMGDGNGYESDGNNSDEESAAQDRTLQRKKMKASLTRRGKSTAAARSEALHAASSIKPVVQVDQSESFLDGEFGEGYDQEEVAEDNADIRTEFEK